MTFEKKGRRAFVRGSPRCGERLGQQSAADLQGDARDQMTIAGTTLLRFPILECVVDPVESGCSFIDGPEDIDRETAWTERNGHVWKQADRGTDSVHPGREGPDGISGRSNRLPVIPAFHAQLGTILL